MKKALRDFLRQKMKLMLSDAQSVGCSHDLVARYPLAPMQKARDLLAIHDGCQDCWFEGRSGPALDAYSPAVDPVAGLAANDNELWPAILFGIDEAIGNCLIVPPGFADFARVDNPHLLGYALIDNGEKPACECSRALFGRAPRSFSFFAGADFSAEEAR